MKKRSKRPRKSSAKSGAAVIWTPILVLAGIFALYIIVKYAPPYITYYQVQQAFITVAHDFGRRSDEEMRSELNHRLQSIRPPFDLSQVALTKVGNTVIIDAQYKVIVRHPILVDRHVLKFNPHAEVSVGAED